MTLNEIYQEINSITLKLVELGLSVQQSFPYRSGNSISCKEGTDLSAVLKNVTYREKYEVLNKEQNYNIKLLDGALIQLMYTFNSSHRKIDTHRLAFFPSPDLENYEDDPASYERKYYGGSEYHDFLENNIIKTPLRFDFNSNVELFKDIDHPYAHFHLGEYEGCRIPLAGPITPSIFINFILRNFYNSALIDYCENYSFPVNKTFAHTITEREGKILHIHFNS